MAGLLNTHPYGGGLLGSQQSSGLLGGIANFFRPWTPEDRARVAAVMPPDLAPTQIVKGMVGGAANLAMQANEAMPWGGNNPQAIGYDPQAGTIDPSKMIPFATDVAGMATTGSLAAPGVQGAVGMGMKADITRPYPRTWEATVDGRKAGRASMTESGEAGPYIDLVMIDPSFKRQGVATQIYDQIESDLGKRLIPSPMGLSDEAVAFWKKRLSGLTDDERQEVLRLGVSIGESQGIGKSTRERFKKLGFSDEDIGLVKKYGIAGLTAGGAGAAMLGGTKDASAAAPSYSTGGRF